MNRVLMLVGSLLATTSILAQPPLAPQEEAVALREERLFALSPQGDRLTATRSRVVDGGYHAMPVFDLLLVGEDGQQTLVDEAAVFSAGFNPDGTFAAYTTFRSEICITELSSLSTRCMTGLPGSFGWSSDGARIAYTRRTGPDESNIFVTTLDTGDTVALTSGAGNRSQPSFSFDGKNVLFVSSQTGLASVWSVSTGAGVEVQLTNKGRTPGPVTGRRPTPVPEGPEGMVWAADGRVAWWGDGEVWVLEPETASARAIARVRGRITSFRANEIVLETASGGRRVLRVEE